MTTGKVYSVHVGGSKRWIAERRVIKRWIAATLMVTHLSACGGPEIAKIHGEAGHHASPVQPPFPALPGGPFDETRAAQELGLARLDRAAGDGVAAREAVLASLNDWPASSAAWLELRAECQMLDDEACRTYAGFFLAKVDFAATLPPRAASLGFETVAANLPGSRAGDYVYDAQTLAMAQRLWVFYGLQDPLKGGTALPEDHETLTDRYPYGAALIFIGTGALLVTLAKTLANK